MRPTWDGEPDIGSWSQDQQKVFPVSGELRPWRPLVWGTKLGAVHWLTGVNSSPQLHDFPSSSLTLLETVYRVVMRISGEANITAEVTVFSTPSKNQHWMSVIGVWLFLVFIDPHSK